MVDDQPDQALQRVRMFATRKRAGLPSPRAAGWPTREKMRFSVRSACCSSSLVPVSSSSSNSERSSRRAEVGCSAKVSIRVSIQRSKRASGSPPAASAAVVRRRSGRGCVRRPRRRARPCS